MRLVSEVASADTSRCPQDFLGRYAGCQERQDIKALLSSFGCKDVRYPGCALMLDSDQLGESGDSQHLRFCAWHFGDSQLHWSHSGVITLIHWFIWFLKSKVFNVFNWDQEATSTVKSSLSTDARSKSARDAAGSMPCMPLLWPEDCGYSRSMVSGAFKLNGSGKHAWHPIETWKVRCVALSNLA
jgi:hypothetical protein